MSKSRPLGPGTRNLTANVPNTLYGEVAKWASVSGCKLGEYVRAVMEFATAQGLIVRDNAEDKMRWYDAVASGQKPLPRVHKEVVLDPKVVTLRLAEDSPGYAAASNPPAPRKRAKK